MFDNTQGKDSRRSAKSCCTATTMALTSITTILNRVEISLFTFLFAVSVECMGQHLSMLRLQQL